MEIKKSLLDKIWEKMIKRWYIALLFMFFLGINFGTILCPLITSCETYVLGVNATGIGQKANITDILRLVNQTK